MYYQFMWPALCSAWGLWVHWFTRVQRYHLTKGISEDPLITLA